MRIRGNGISGGRLLSPTLTNGALPMNYDGLQVLIGYYVASLLEIEADQITFLVPSDLPTSGSASIEIVQNGLVTSELNCPLQATVPAIITASGSGLGAAAALNQDGTANSPSNPTAPGSIVSLYMTGLGLTNPAVYDGTVTINPGALEASIQVAFPDSFADILYAGPAPGLISGVYQVNIRVPDLALVGWLPFGVQVGGQDAQSSFDLATPLSPPEIGNPEVGIYVSCAVGATCISY